MLWFLSLAAGEGFQVDSYADEAVGHMTKDDSGVLWISSVRLNPKIEWGGAKIPAPADEQRLHHLAHGKCFIANSVKTRITVGDEV
jgi:organic hydroperoxide reductase OsmC/OhrA